MGWHVAERTGNEIARILLRRTRAGSYLPSRAAVLDTLRAVAARVASRAHHALSGHACYHRAMATTPLPLAGLCSYATAALPGLGVAPTVERLRRYVWLEAQFVQIAAVHFNGVPEWETKGALALHLWQDAEHGTWFRTRVTEMRTPPHHLDRAPDPALAAFTAELAQARDSDELLVAIYGVAKPALAAAWRAHLASAHPLADQPTRRLLGFALSEIEAQLAWAQTALAALPPERRAALAAWRAHLAASLAAAGGINGEDPRPATPPPAPRAREGAAATTLRPRRDARFPHVWNSRGVVPTAERPVHERIWWMMNVRLNEMHVAELIATVIADWRDQPWEFYRDLARHLWDETRHCMLGEVAFASQGIDFTQLPTHTGFAEYPNTHLAPPDRYAFLWGIEQGLMGKSGKQAEVVLAQAGADERATVFQDFDWADEVLHAQIGRRWLEPHYGDRAAMLAVYERIRPAYDAMKAADLALPGRDWWPAFYARHLAHKDPHLGQAAPGNAAPPPTAGGY
jgi:hypothetical protein